MMVVCLSGEVRSFWIVIILAVVFASVHAMALARGHPSVWMLLRFGFV